jgi:hypothetical protein
MGLSCFHGLIVLPCLHVLVLENLKRNFMSSCCKTEQISEKRIQRETEEMDNPEIKVSANTKQACYPSTELPASILKKAKKPHIQQSK